jgi:hypothetical protein
MNETIYLDPDNSIHEHNYICNQLDGGWRRVFPPDYIEVLKPISETLAMLDGNCWYFPDNPSWIQYLPEADAVYRANSCPESVSWLKHFHHEDPTLQDAWNKYQMLLELKREENV